MKRARTESARTPRAQGMTLVLVLSLASALACDGGGLGPAGAPTNGSDGACHDYVTPDGFTCCCGSTFCTRTPGCSRGGGAGAPKTVGAEGGTTNHGGEASGGRSGLPSLLPAASGGFETGSGGAGSGGAANGGRGVGFPSSPSDASAAGSSGGASDGAAPVCPILVSGTDLTEADCYACIRSDQCVSIFQSPTLFPPEKCVDSVKANAPSSSWCVWYADDAPVDRNTAFVTCKTSPGRVVCGGGL